MVHAFSARLLTVLRNQIAEIRGRNTTKASTLDQDIGSGHRPNYGQFLAYLSLPWLAADSGESGWRAPASYQGSLA